MKKFVAVVVTAMLASATAMANDFKDFTHWSLMLNGGISQFDGDVAQGTSAFPAAKVQWGLGLEGEYTWNPYWGLMLQFNYIPYAGTTKGSYGNNSFKGYSLDPSLMVSLNLLNLFSPYRHDAHWGLYANVGLGMSFYHVTSVPTEEGASTKAEDVKMENSLLIPLGVNAEYNINDYLAVGLSAYYRMHNKDHFEAEAVTQGSSNDAVFTFSANLRVKLAPHKKQAHMRNVSMYDYHKMHSEEGASKDALDSLKEAMAAQQSRLAALEDSLYNQTLPTMDNRMDDLENRHMLMEEGCCKRVDTLVTRMEALEEKVTYIQKDDTTVVKLDGAAESVYFPLNRSYLTTRAKKTVAEMANRMKQDEAFKLIIVGYSDASGNAEYNKQMTERRAESVRKYLISCGVDSNRVTVEPRGVVPDSKSYDSNNRRCDLVIEGVEKQVITTEEVAVPANEAPAQK